MMYSKNLIITATVSSLFLLTTVSYANDVFINDVTPEINFNDTSPEASSNPDWTIFGENASSMNRFQLFDRAYTPFVGGNAVLDIFSTGSSIQSLRVDTTGDISLAQGSVFINKSEDRLGIGNVNPQSNLHITDVFPTLRMEDIDDQITWEFDSFFGGFNLNNYDSTDPNNLNNATFDIFSVRPGAGSGSLVISGNSNIGIGTFSPESKLHVKDNSPTVAVRNVVKLSNNGSVGFELEDTSIGNSWDFRTAANGGFLVSNIGVPGSKLQINQDGAVFLGGTNFILNAGGNMTLAGNSTALAHISTSSREAKTDFESINPKEIMDKIKSMEVSEWRYKDTAVKGRHIGPVAEDFYSLFKLGADDKHIAATDMASIALVASKELQKKTISLETENSELKQQVENQNKRLAQLEELVMNLASGENTLPTTGKKVVLNK